MWKQWHELQMAITISKSDWLVLCVPASMKFFSDMRKETFVKLKIELYSALKISKCAAFWKLFISATLFISALKSALVNLNVIQNKLKNPSSFENEDLQLQRTAFNRIAYYFLPCFLLYLSKNVCFWDFSIYVFQIQWSWTRGPNRQNMS